MQRQFVTGTVTAMVLALGVTLVAQRPGGQGRGPGGGPPPGGDQSQRGRVGRPGGPGPCDPAILKQQLNMTTDQAASFDRIKQAEMDASKPIVEQIQALLNERQQGSGPPSSDFTAKLDDLNKQLATVRQGAHAQIVAMLTPEQQQKLQELQPPPGQRGPRRGGPPDGGTRPDGGQRGPRRGGAGLGPC